MNLIHEKAAFTKDAIAKRAKQFGFANPLAVELFLWDLELACQIQKASAKIILKGGAAVQLFLPVEEQRGSVDIDMVTGLSESSLAKSIENVGSNIGSGVRFEEYIPKKPKPGMRAKTYYAHTSSLTQDDPLRVKLDFLLENTRLPIREVVGVQTFATRTSRLRCFTPEVLVGDKLLTLAQGSIGLKDIADYPKQIYDISKLVESTETIDFEVVVAAVKQVTEIEAKIAGVKIDSRSALDDVIKFVNRSLAPIDTVNGDKIMREKIEGFEQFFAPKGQRVSLHEWSSRSLRIRFAASLAKLAIEDQFQPKKCESILKTAVRVAASLNEITGSEVSERRKELLLFQKGNLSYFKELRGKPLERVFWQVVSSDNLDKIAAS